MEVLISCNLEHEEVIFLLFTCLQKKVIVFTFQYERGKDKNKTEFLKLHTLVAQTIHYVCVYL